MQSKNDLRGAAVDHVSERQAMLRHARWLSDAIRASIDDPRTSVPHEVVMAEVFGDVRRG